MPERSIFCRKKSGCLFTGLLFSCFAQANYVEKKSVMTFENALIFSVGVVLGLRSIIPKGVFAPDQAKNLQQILPENKAEAPCIKNVAESDSQELLNALEAENNCFLRLAGVYYVSAEISITKPLLSEHDHECKLSSVFALDQAEKTTTYDSAENNYKLVTTQYSHTDCPGAVIITPVNTGKIFLNVKKSGSLDNIGVVTEPEGIAYDHHPESAVTVMFGYSQPASLSGLPGIRMFGPKRKGAGQVAKDKRRIGLEKKQAKRQEVDLLSRAHYTPEVVAASNPAGGGGKKNPRGGKAGISLDELRECFLKFTRDASQKLKGDFIASFNSAPADVQARFMAEYEGNDVLKVISRNLTFK